jgi:hypothetical protein
MTRELTSFEVVANPRRRWTIGVLALTPQTEISVDTVADLVSEFEFQAPTTKETKRVRTSLRNGHLQQLEAVGAVSVSNDRISRGPAFPAMVRLIAAGIACEQT